MNRMVSLVLWLYARLLHLYPHPLREAFGDEILAVFDLRLREAQTRGPMAVACVLWAELRDLPGILLRSGAASGAAPPSWLDRLAICAAMAPFLLSALLQLLNGLMTSAPRLAMSLNLWLGSATLAIWALILLVGIVRGLPRWSLPGVGMLLLFATVILNGGSMVLGVRLRWRITYPIWIDWIGQIVLPLIALLAVALAVCLALPWLRPLFRRWQRDWTQLSFALYGAMLFTLEMLDMHPREVPLSVAGLLILAGGAWAYMRAQTTAGRILALSGAITLMMLIITPGAILLNDPVLRQHFSLWSSLGQALAGWLWLLLALFAPALLALLPRQHQTAPPTAAHGSPRARPGRIEREARTKLWKYVRDS